MRFGDIELDLKQPRVMGILNVTPDSFYDGGRLMRGERVNLDRLLYQAEQMVRDGADILDIGGESTRPGAEPVEAAREVERVVPAVEAVKQRLGVVVSVDTSNPAVIQGAAAAGAGLINDVRALQVPDALRVAAETGLPVCLMHMQGGPQDMQHNPQYADVVEDVRSFLQQRMAEAGSAGMAASSILVDPGIGFGKRDEENLCLLRNLDRLRDLAPVLVGVSRKSLFGRLLGRELADRLPASIATGVLALINGASILRVHDVAATKDAVCMFQYLRSGDGSTPDRRSNCA